MKRICLLIAVVLICMGGCYKIQDEIEETPARQLTQVHVQTLTVQEPEYGESLDIKRQEFRSKMQEIRRALRSARPVLRNDTIHVEPARPLHQ